MEPTVCPDCTAVFHEGRWQWIDPVPKGANQTRCQACHRIRDGHPAGIITLRGDYARRHRGELLEMARHCEAEEKRSHPLRRIMSIEDHTGTVVIKTTDLHLPQHIAETLRQVHCAIPQIQYDEKAYFVRIAWQRDT